MPTSVPEARHAARDLAERHGVDDQVLEAMMLCVTEAVANAVVHAYRDRAEPGDVELSATRVGDALCVHVRDDGRGMTPRPDRPGAGLGLPLIALYAEQFEIRASAAQGTEIVMLFPLAG